MINVPERVKDALRDGRMRKNYRFVVKSWRDVAYYIYEHSFIRSETYSDIYTITKTGNYQAAGSASTLLGRAEVGNERTARNFNVYGGDIIKLYEGDYIYFYDMNVNTITMNIQEIKKELQTDFTIDNDTLVKETVNFDERMCSGDRLKFGLCEGTSLEFQYFDHPNIVGRQIEAFIDVQYKDGDGTLKWHAIPMGFYDVDECSMQFSTGIRKCTAYNKLKAKYLDEKANNNELIEYYFGSFDNKIKLFELLRVLLNGYVIKPDYGAVPGRFPSSGDMTMDFEETVYDNITFKFGAQYGIDTPLSYYEYSNAWAGGTVLTNLHPYITTRLYEYKTLKDYRIVESFIGNFELFERTIYERLIYEYDKAGFVNNSNVHVTGNTIVDGMCAHSIYKFSRIVGITVPMEQTVSGISYNYEDYYSNIQYEYEEAHGLSHSRKIANGVYSYTHRTREAFTKLMEHDFYLSLPLEFGVFQGTYGPSGQSDGMLLIPIDGNTGAVISQVTYRYYIDSSLTNYIEKNLPHILYPNGNTYIADYTVAKNTIGAMAANANELGIIYEVEVTPSELPDYSLRDLQSGAFETICQFGKLDRVTDLFSGVELNGSRLYPADNLYPSETRYPDGGVEGSFKSQYSKLWFDEGGIQSWRYLIITYKGLEDDGNGNQTEKEFKLQRTINEHGTTDYNMSDNWLFRNLIWTEEQVGDYADAMVQKMQNMTWFPFEMWAAGLPYIETGDEIEIHAHENTYTSYILQRQLKGIQNLEDKYINGELDIF